MPRRVDLTGQTFGRLTVLGRSEIQIGPKTLWRCRCECGGTTDVRTDFLKNGNVKSCGCLHTENAEKRRLEFLERGHKVYQPKERQPKPPGIKHHPYYQKWCWIRWYAREHLIEFYEKWADFNTFINDVGSPPDEDYCLIRIDKRKGWMPNNVRWQQGRKAGTLNTVRQHPQWTTSRTRKRRYTDRAA